MAASLFAHERRARAAKEAWHQIKQKRAQKGTNLIFVVATLHRRSRRFRPHRHVQQPTSAGVARPRRACCPRRHSGARVSGGPGDVCRGVGDVLEQARAPSLYRRGYGPHSLVYPAVDGMDAAVSDNEASFGPVKTKSTCCSFRLDQGSGVLSRVDWLSSASSSCFGD